MTKKDTVAPHSSLEVIWSVRESQKVIENHLDSSRSLKMLVPLTRPSQSREEEIMEDQPSLGI